MQASLSVQVFLFARGAATWDMSFQYAYFHGFGSSPLSKKGVKLANYMKALGITLHMINLSVPSFENLSVTTGLEAFSALDRAENDRLGKSFKWRLIGSSLGGFQAARWAELNPDRVVEQTKERFKRTRIDFCCCALLLES